jgi:AraC-like DNA-binding protein
LNIQPTKDGIRKKTAPAGSSNNLHVSYWGTQPCPPGHNWGPGVRDHHKLHFIHSGTGVLRFRGVTYELGEGQGFYTPPNEIVHYTADAEEPWVYSWLGFSGSQADAIIGRTALPDQPVFDNVTAVNESWFDQLSDMSDRPGGDLLLQGVLLELLAALIRQAPAAPSGPDTVKPREEYVRRAADFIHRHYAEEVSMKQLSDYLGLDRKYVATLFRESLGLPPQQYLLRYRMDKACELLRSTGLTVAEIARSVGYKDALLFSRMFKKVIGVPPSKYGRDAAH